MSFLDEIPITSGFRYSSLGYTDIPEVAAFTKDPLFEIFSNRKDQRNFGTGMKFEDIWRSLKIVGDKNLVGAFQLCILLIVL